MEPDNERTYSGFDYRSLLPTTSSNSDPNLEISNDSRNTASDVCAWMPALSWRERCIGCATCVVAGYLLSMGSFWRLKDLFGGNPVPFVVNATVGNLIALAGSCFLSGPTSQVQKMFRPVRRAATTAYLGSLVLTLVIAFFGGKLPLRGLILLLLMLLQYVAIAWYTLSYIPMGQEAVRNFALRWWNRNSDEY